MAYFRSVGGSGTGATITVSYSSEFYGETITCSHGTKTYSKTAPSTGTVEFTVYEEGTWTISCTIGADTYSTTAEIDLTESVVLDAIPNGETVLPTDDIETWLACAGITDKAYTTLSQVLGDSETYNALLGDSNACAYMKRSTTWSTDICASQYAMNLLGQYDTACDALLSDSTWAGAINSSSYADYVLPIKVPTMTSASTPSGLCFADSKYTGNTYDPWKAFDGNSSTLWVTNALGESNNNFIGYIFTSACKVAIASVMFSTASPITAAEYKIQGSNDTTTGADGTWTDVSDVSTTITAGSFVNLLVNATTNYKAYRLYFNSCTAPGSGYPTGRVAELQFYGRTTSSEMVHGANGESAYILDGGSPVTITDPSTLDAGTYTVYSTVAKNPSDLTADYSKTIRICPNTKEIVVRPDNSLYWWGWINWSSIEELSSANGWIVSGGSFGSPTYNSNNVSITGGSTLIRGLGGKSIDHPLTGEHHLIWYGGNVTGLVTTLGQNKNLSYTENERILAPSSSSTTVHNHVAYSGVNDLAVRARATSGGNSLIMNAWWYE